MPASIGARRPGERPMIVDVHAHYFPKDHNDLLARMLLGLEH